jgi:TonB family protein
MRYAFLAAIVTVAAPHAALAQTPTASPPPADTTASPIVERNNLVIRKFYPASSLRRGEEGRVAFRMILNRAGRMDACQVTKSSGYAALDKATCDMILAGATGQVMRNADNRRVSYQRDGVVDWALPEGVARPAVKPPFDVRSASSGEALICHRQQKTGSLVDQKVCLTREDWKRQQAYAQEETQKMQAPRGPAGGPL